MKILRISFLAAILAISGLVAGKLHRSANVELDSKREAAQQAAADLDRLSGENRQLSNTLVRMNNSSPPADGELQELMKLRNEVGRLQKELSETNSLRREILRLREGLQDIESNFVSVTLTATLADETPMRRARIARLQQWLTESPSEKIPELQFLSELEWLRAVENPVVDTDEECRETMSHLRRKAEETFSRLAANALQKYAQSNDGRFPTTIAELKPYFAQPIDDAVLERYQVVPTDTMPPGMFPRVSGDWVITQKAPVNPALDYRSIIGFNGPRPLTDRVPWSPK